MFSTNGSLDVDLMTITYRPAITHYPRRHNIPTPRCAEFVSSGADLIPSYCNVALLHAQESSTARARYQIYILLIFTESKYHCASKIWAAHYTRRICPTYFLSIVQIAQEYFFNRQMRGWGWAEWTEWGG